MTTEENTLYEKIKEMSYEEFSSLIVNAESQEEKEYYVDVHNKVIQDAQAKIIAKDYFVR
ncbi:DNA replication initiation complex subunit (GINS family) [Enterococcus sp. PF1-24]|uniref:hypothetical protein n=1 Tax=unclassified Enterococcus TaxID=2608891 RepID=UPI0024734C39|nr:MULTISPECIES: hypothetical protein [unclassified Enterococcus]MDH6365658.1 DNA replication initiation complex subunit (GINS family) [Enterococcus sp. PFB1-1]MDH6402766.1 DNA replication initiation complex subunit (GINS family) [Enterococcus sp. PF1-24]